MIFTIELPYPDPILSPNARAHWAKVNAAKQEQKTLALYEVRREHGFGRCQSARLTVTFHPPDKRKRDIDNAFASMKNGWDGIASALGMDDSAFTFTLHPMGAPRKGGAVIVEVEAT
jgi:crossover junction endodeoxyribonuclease RusA